MQEAGRALWKAFSLMEDKQNNSNNKQKLMLDNLTYKGWFFFLIKPSPCSDLHQRHSINPVIASAHDNNLKVKLVPQTVLISLNIL